MERVFSFTGARSARVRTVRVRTAPLVYLCRKKKFLTRRYTLALLATACAYSLAPARCPCALRAVFLSSLRPLALRSRAHSRRLAYFSRAPSARFASLAFNSKPAFCIISSRGMWKRGFPTIRAPKLQAYRARPVGAPLSVQKEGFE